MQYPVRRLISGKSGEAYHIEIYPLDQAIYQEIPGYQTDAVSVVVRADWTDYPYDPYYSSDAKKFNLHEIIYVGEISREIYFMLKNSDTNCFKEHGATNLCYIPEKDKKTRLSLIGDLLAKYNPVCQKMLPQQISAPQKILDKQEPKPQQSATPVSEVQPDRTGQPEDVIEKELDRITKLKEHGYINDEEYQTMRKKALGI